MPITGQQPLVKPPYMVTPSNSIITQSLVEDYTNCSGSVAFLKEIQVSVSGFYRVYFTAKSTQTADAWCKIYRNGISYGIQHNLTTEYQVFSEDLVFQAGDRIQIHMYSSSGTQYVKDFKVCGNIVYSFAVVNYP